MIGLLLLTCASVAAQEADEAETPRVELPITYVYERADRNPDGLNVNGFAVSPTLKVTPRVGIVGAFTYARGPRENVGPFAFRADSFEVGGGVDFTVARSRRVKLGLEAEVGVEHERVRELTTGFNESENSAYLFIGGVVDLETSNKHISVRLIKAGYKPTFFGSETQNNFRLETGIIFNFGHLGGK